MPLEDDGTRDLTLMKGRMVDKELTIVIPSYNMELFLPKCLESLGFNQLRKERVAEGETLKYYRVDGVHFVPKIRVEDLLL